MQVDAAVAGSETPAEIRARQLAPYRALSDLHVEQRRTGAAPPGHWGWQRERVLHHVPLTAVACALCRTSLQRAGGADGGMPTHGAMGVFALRSFGAAAM